MSYRFYVSISAPNERLNARREARRAESESAQFTSYGDSQSFVAALSCKCTLTVLSQAHRALPIDSLRHS